MMSHVKPDKLCRCGAPARNGQRNCLKCAAAANRAYRKRKRLARAADISLVIAKIAEAVRNA